MLYIQGYYKLDLQPTFCFTVCIPAKIMKPILMCVYPHVFVFTVLHIGSCLVVKKSKWRVTVVLRRWTVCYG